MKIKIIKLKLALLFFITIYTNNYGQFAEAQILTVRGELENSTSVYTADLDNDGDLDILTSSLFDNKIAWYENTNGQGDFGPLQIITTDAVFARSVFAADIDNDGDIDVLSASSIDNKIAWYENTDGQGNFGIQQVISTNADDPREIYAIDIDNDGDIDVISASEDDDKIAWYENIDGQGTFSAQQIITTDAETARSVYVTDIDGDSDLDVLSASSIDNKIAWYENTDGQGTFGAQQIITTNAIYAKSVYAADLDGDGDMDVLSASSDDNKIAWYKNTDSQGTFGAQQIITTNAETARSVYAADIDNDGDMDVLSASRIDSKLSWYENTDGQGNFGAQQIIPIGILYNSVDIIAADIDSDGDLDLISASGSGVAWNENLTVLSVNQNTLLDFAINPNPITTTIKLKSKTKINSVKIYNSIGQQVFLKTNTSLNQEDISIDISVLNKGIYLIKVKGENNNYGIKKIIKE